MKKIKCPHCGMEFSKQENPTYSCKDCTWLEDDGYCGYKDENVSGEMIVCDGFDNGKDNAEYKW